MALLYLKELIPGSTEAEADITVDCCANNLCNGQPPPEGKNQQSQTSSASTCYASFSVVTLLLFLLL